MFFFGLVIWNWLSLRFKAPKSKLSWRKKRSEVSASCADDEEEKPSMLPMTKA